MSQIYQENGIDVAVADSDPIETRHCECNEPIQRPVADTKCDTSVSAQHENGQPIGKPSRDEAEDAIRTLLRWAGDKKEQDNGTFQSRQYMGNGPWRR